MSQLGSFMGIVGIYLGMRDHGYKYKLDYCTYMCHLLVYILTKQPLTFASL